MRGFVRLSQALGSGNQGESAEASEMAALADALGAKFTWDRIVLQVEGLDRGRVLHGVGPARR